MNQTLEELEKEYIRALELQQELIEEYREKLKAARSRCSCNEIKRLNSHLRLLYEEKYELEDSIHIIKGYLD